MMLLISCKRAINRVSTVIIYQEIQENHFFDELVLMTSSQMVKKLSFCEISKSSNGFNLSTKWHFFVKKYILKTL